jgi:hypothetical protein
MNSDFNKSPDPNATRCDLCGQRQKSVRPRRVITVGKNSGTVRTKFCDQCAAVVKEWLGGAQSPPEDTIAVATNEPLTPAQGKEVTHCLVETEADRDLLRMVEKYEALESNQKSAFKSPSPIMMKSHITFCIWGRNGRTAFGG